MKKIISILIILCIFVLTGCSDINNFLDNKNSEIDEVSAEVENFLFLLGNDIESAKIYLHPNFYADKGDFDAFIKDFEQEYGANILDGIAIMERKQACKSSLYYPSNGYTCLVFEFCYKLVIDTKPMLIYIKLIEDDQGRGIYLFEKYNGQMD